MSDTHQSIGHAAFMLLRYVSHIGKDHGEGYSKHTGHRDNCKIPPETEAGYGTQLLLHLTQFHLNTSHYIS